MNQAVFEIFWLADDFSILFDIYQTADFAVYYIIMIPQLLYDCTRYFQKRKQEFYESSQINVASESKLQNGLVAYHAYSITGVKGVPHILCNVVEN